MATKTNRKGSIHDSKEIDDTKRETLMQPDRKRNAGVIAATILAASMATPKSMHAQQTEKGQSYYSIGTKTEIESLSEMADDKHQIFRHQAIHLTGRFLYSNDKDAK